MAIAFTLAHPAVTSTIIGPRTREQLDDLLGAARRSPGRRDARRDRRAGATGHARRRGRPRVRPLVVRARVAPPAVVTRRGADRRGARRARARGLEHPAQQLRVRRRRLRDRALRHRARLSEPGGRDPEGGGPLPREATTRRSERWTISRLCSSGSPKIARATTSSRSTSGGTTIGAARRSCAGSSAYFRERNVTTLRRLRTWATDVAAGGLRRTHQGPRARRSIGRLRCGWASTRSNPTSMSCGSCRPRSAGARPRRGRRRA